MTYVIQMNELELALQTLNKNNSQPVFVGNSNSIVANLIDNNEVSITLGLKVIEANIETVVERRIDSKDWFFTSGYESPLWQLK